MTQRRPGEQTLVTREGHTPHAGWFGVPAGLALGAATWLAVRGAFWRPFSVLFLVGLASVFAFVAFGWPLLFGLVGVTRVSVGGGRWRIERRVLGFSWRQVEGRVGDVVAVDEAVRHRGGRVGVALVTGRRAVMVVSHQRAEQRRQLAAALKAALGRRDPV